MDNDKIKQSNYYNNLDIIRSLAVMLVFICHFIAIYKPNLLLEGITYDGQKFINIQSIGTLGVLIFFVHTSFVLMHSLQLKYFTSKIKFLSFYIKRIFRVYPLSITAVIIYYIINSEKEISIKLLISNIFLIQNLVFFEDLPGEKSVPGILWTLPYEIQFYILLPFIFNMLKKNYNKIIYLYIFTIIFILINKYFNTPLFNIFKYLPCFLSGIIGYIYKSKVKLNIFYLLFFIFLSIIILPLVAAKNIIPSNIIGVVFCFVLGLLVSNSREVKNKFAVLISRLIAKYSYGIYIFHIFIINIYVNLEIFFFYKLILTIFTLSIIVLASYHSLESPMIKIGKKLSNDFTK